jgi:N-acetylmuramoyl-L-alanine amidase
MSAANVTPSRLVAAGVAVAVAIACVATLATGTAFAARGVQQHSADNYRQVPSVMRLQNDLGYLNYYESPVDGIDGPQTHAAVRDFQRNNGLVVDGIAGPRTWALIKQQTITGDSRMTAGTPATDLVPAQH